MMPVLYALRQNGTKRIQSLLPVLRMVQTRSSSALNDVDKSDQLEPPSKKVKVSKDSVIYSTGSYSNTIQDASSNSPHALTAQAKASDETTLRDRVDSPWKVGAHVSSAGGVESAIINAVTIGSVHGKYGPSHQNLTIFFRANSFALFLKSPRAWTSPSLTPESVSEFRKRMKQHGYAANMVLPHGSYLINLGNPDKFVQTIFFTLCRDEVTFILFFYSKKREKSYECFFDDLKRCEELGLELYNFQYASGFSFFFFAFQKDCFSYNNN